MSRVLHGIASPYPLNRAEKVDPSVAPGILSEQVDKPFEVASTYALIGADGRPHWSPSKGRWGGHRGSKIYGRMDCPAVVRAIARGGYLRHRVFFADEATAITAGYRPAELV